MFMQEKIKEIDDRLKALEKASHVAVWGAGIHTAKLFEKTELLSYNIEIILDMNKTKQGEHYFKWVIEAPENVIWKEIDAVVISVPNCEKNITNMLRDEFGYYGAVITFYDEEKKTPFYLLYDEKVPGIRYMGDYGSWNDVVGECKGYDDSEIIDKVISSTQKVLNGEAVWERDSYLFYQEKYVYKICAAILRCAVQNVDKKRKVKVLDIGGALGSTYFQNRKYLTDLDQMEYVIAEQDHYADYGHNYLENETLKFIRSTDKWEDLGPFDMVLMSGSLQYIPFFEEIIARIKMARPRYIILDRVLVSNRRRICKETIPETIYRSSYPVIIFSEDEMEDMFGSDYTLIENDVSSVPEEACFVDGKAESKYYAYKYIEK